MRLAGWAMLALALVGGAVRADDSTALADNLKHWLTLVDRQQYGDSWGEAGALFRGGITERAWQARIAQVRGPLGAVIKRSLQGQKYTTTLPGLPDGDYDIVRFNTVFEHKAVAVETVVLAKEERGWKVNGYFIK